MVDVANTEAGDHPPSPLAALLPLACNVPMETLADNVNRSIERGGELLQAQPPHDGVAVIIGGGPSIEDQVGTLRLHSASGHHLFAMNGSGLWLQRQGIVPQALILLDARPHNARFVQGLDRRVVLYIASQCDEIVFAAAKNHRVIMWHPTLSHPNADTRPNVNIGGGTSTGNRALRLVHVIGYREAHLYGYDSSYRDGDSHAFDQFENAGDRAIEIYCGGRWFVTTPWMARQAEDFQKIAMGLIAEGLAIHVHGDGLLPEVARQMTTE